MKRIAVILAGVAVMLAVATAGHAYKIRIGSTLATDVFYTMQTGPAYVGPFGTRDSRQPDLTTFTAQVTSGSLTFMYFSEDRTVGAHISLALTAGAAHGAQNVQLLFFYGWYRIGRFRLSIGHMDNLFASSTYAPYAGLGFQSLPDGSGGLYDFGKLYSGRFAQIGLYYGLGRWQFMIAVGAPPLNSDNFPAWRNNQNVIVGFGRYPRIDLAAEYRAKNFSLAPGVSIYRTEWEGAEGVTLKDDYVLSYALVLPFRASFGNFGLTGEVSYGRNWRAANMRNPYQGAYWWGAGWNDNLDRVKAADTDMYSACLGLYYRLGKTTIWLSGGWQMVQNGSSDGFGTWRHGQNTRWAVVLAAPHKVNRHFTIAPEIGYYFYGWDPTQDVGGASNWGTPGGATSTSTTADLGSAWLIGIRFIVWF
jgi:hypothetical protein